MEHASLFHTKTDTRYAQFIEKEMLVIVFTSQPEHIWSTHTNRKPLEVILRKPFAREPQRLH